MKKDKQFLVNELSVIVPVFNGELTLKKCLSGVFNQKYLPSKFEVVVINDGSMDKSAEIAKRFPVRLINLLINFGRITARDVGVKKAKYKYILFIDADCVPTRNWLLEILQKNYQPVMGKVINHYQNILGRFFYLMRRFFYKQVSEPTELTEQNFLRLPTGTGNFLCSKELYLRVNLTREGESFSDDQVLIFGVNKLKPVLVIPDGSVFHDERYHLRSILVQWFQRGCRFADFHLRKEGYLGNKIKYWLLVSVLLIITIFSFLGFKILLFILSMLVLAGFIIISIQVTEEWNDPLIIIVFLPIVSIIFFFGVIRNKLLWIK